MTTERPSTEAGLRVLLVDDSAVVRRIMLDVLRSEPGIAHVGSASSGRAALAMIDELKPDVVVLDVEMPGIDGRQTLAELHRRWPQLPVVMFSSVSDKSAAATFDAMAQGAKDFVTKPSMAGSLAGALASVKANLVPIVHTWGSISQTRLKAERLRAVAKVAPSRPAAAPTVKVVQRQQGSGRVAAVVMASSTGGPNALNEIVPALSGNLRVPVLLVQHMPVTFTRHLAERLDGISALHVVEAAPGTVVEAGHLYVARGGEHMEVRRSGGQIVIELNSKPPENSCRPAADVLFRSAVAAWGGDLLGVVLTGMGQDGMLGAKAIVEAGGAVLAQDADSSVVWGMPGAVVNAGLAAEVLPLSGMAAAMEARVARGGARK
ncbi:MAG: chemotaxis response regulator protein-glutamate methylesterase [Acidobacteriota bacterium]|nr:chemotaxis response regulator protein-glutamate methylesterase [Acidobacteriota bacterium]